MSQMYSEEQILKKLDIPDFRHMTKDKIITFASNLQNMPPEVAVKAIEQFPDFASNSLEMMKEYRSLLSELISENGESSKSVYDTYDRVLDSLEELLKNEQLSFEDKKFILEQMREIAEAVDRKDSENKSFWGAIAKVGMVAMAGIVVALSAALGGGTKD